MRKFIALMMFFFFVASAKPVEASVDPFAAVPLNHWAYDAIGQLVSCGIFSGYPDELYRSKQPITRYEMASALARAISVLDMTKASKQEGEMLRLIIIEFKDELVAFGVNVDQLDKRKAAIKDRLNRWNMSCKPVIYLYPKEATEVTVKLDYNGVLEYTYPTYSDGWKVTALPDGTLTNHADGREYSYLFWEGKNDTPFDFNKGFVVKGSDTIQFLQEKLSFLGLTPREYNEFIVYWLPRMRSNPYNLISFQGAMYIDSASLTINPKPDSILRVFMAFKPLKEAIKVEPQKLEPFERKGFTVVEWGGSECQF